LEERKAEILSRKKIKFENENIYDFDPEKYCLSSDFSLFNYTELKG